MVRRIVVDLKKYYGYGVMSARDSGKSVWLEWCAEHHFNAGWLVCDWFDAGDFENLFWCVKGKNRYPILLIHPEYVEVHGGDSYVKPILDKVGLEEILRTAIDERRVCCLSPGLYQGDDYWVLLSRFLRRLPELNRDVLKTDIIVLLREASNVAFSHIRTTRGESYTRTAILRFMRISRHFRVSFIFDAQRLGDIYKGIRTLIDRVIIKRTPPYTLPNELLWIHKRVEQKRWDLLQISDKALAAKYFPSISHLYVNEFYCTWPDGVFKKLENPMPSFKHKEPQDSFDDLTGISFLFKPKPKTERQVKREEERDQKVQMALNLKKKGYTNTQIADAIGFKTGQAVTMMLKRHKSKD